MKTTLFKYIFKMQLKTMLFVSFFMFCLILLFDFAEVTRKFPISNLQQVMFAVKLSFLRTPRTFCEIFHYIYFIVAAFTLWHLTSSNQMTILKSAGRSPQQILFPFISCAIFIASCWLFILHPAGNYAGEKYNHLAKDQLHEINENIWIDYSGNNQLIFIKQIVNNNINGLYIFDTGNNKKIFAKHAVIKEKCWDLSEITVIDCNVNSTKNINNLKIYNRVSNDLINLLAKEAHKHNIYDLRKIYQIQKKDQVSLKSYELELHNLLAFCMHFILFALIAAAICFPINRYRTKTSVAFQVIIIAIVLRFLNSMLVSLAQTGILNIALAAWAVVLVAIFVTVGVLIWKEV